MALSTAKAISVFFDEVCEYWDANNVFAYKADTIDQSGEIMQNSSNTIWRQVEQQSPEKEGWDMTGLFGDVIELSYPSTLSSPKNDAFQLRADDFRDERFMKRRAKTAVNTLSAKQNGRIAQLVVDTGSLVTQSTVAGYDHLASPEALMDTLELSGMGERTAFLKPVNYQAISSDLANRGTLSKLPEGAYSKSNVGSDIAGFDVYRANAIPTLAGSAVTGVTVSGAQTFKPEGFVTNTDGTDVPVDYRIWDLTVNTTAGLVRGDRITIAGVNWVGLANKDDSGIPATFPIVEVVDGTTLRLYNKPISVSDGTLTAEEAAYANVTGLISDTAAVTVINANAAGGGLDVWQPDVFWTDDSVEIVNGDAPFEFMSEMDGFKVMRETLDSGTTLYIMYQGDIGTATLNCRVFAWYGLVNKKPSHNGIILPNFP